MCNLFLALCSDTQARKVDSAEMQTVLIAEFFAEIKPMFRDLVSSGKPESDICSWTYSNNFFSIRCVDGSLSSLALFFINQGNFRISWLPACLKSLKIVQCEQRYPLDTRSLPRALERANFSMNYIFGPCDLPSLPTNIQELDISDNEISGPIHLVHLPRQMRTLDISQNKMRQRTMYYADLPARFHSVNLSGNEIHAVRPLHKGDVSSNGVFFDGIHPTKVDAGMYSVIKS